MTNPIDVERRYLELKSRLENVSSLRLRWRLVGSFLREIEEEYARYDTYLIQLVPHLPVFEDPLSYAGSDPESLDQLLTLLLKCRESIPELSEHSRYLRSRDALADAAALLYAFAGSVDRLVPLVVTTRGIGVDTDYSWVKDIHQHPDADPNEKLERLTDTARDRGLFELADYLQGLLNRWVRQLQPDGNTGLIPVVEHSGQQDLDVAGRLRRLQVRVIEGSRETRDRLQSNFAVWGAETPRPEFAESILRAARHLINHSHPGLRNRFFTLQLRYQMHGGWHTGSSLGLAAAALCYCAMLYYSGQRERYGVDSRAVLTGRISQDGEMQPVDDAGISAKVDAAFFSWARYLVVPKEQQAEFEQELQSRRQKYPHRRLEVIGINRLEELFYDRRLTRHVVDSRPIYYGKQLWKRKTSIGGISVVAVLLLVIAGLVYGPIDKNPVSTEVDGEYLVLYNKYGNQIERVHVGQPTADHIIDGEKRNQRFLLIDSDNDGINEVVWGTYAGKSTSGDSFILARALGDSDLSWEISLNFKMDDVFPKIPGMIEDNFFVEELAKITDPDTGKESIVALCNSRHFFPSFLFKIDPETGEILNRYLHVGRLYDIALMDLNGDGHQEILGAGVNNALWSGVLTVINPKQWDGHSPTTGDYNINGYGKASEKAYIQVPHTIVGKVFDRMKGTMAIRISTEESDTTFSMYVYDARMASNTPFEVTSGKIIIYFDQNLTVKDIGTDDDYDVLAKQLYRDGEIPFIPNHDYFEAFKDSLLYWDGEGFAYGYQYRLGDSRNIHFK